MDILQVIGLTSYGSAAGLYLLLLALLITSWRGRLQGLLVVLAAFATLCWAMAAAAHLVNHTHMPLYGVTALEGVRNFAWFLVFLRLLEGRSANRLPGGYGPVLAAGGVALVYLFALASGGSTTTAAPFLAARSILTVHLLLCLGGVVLAEQLYRHTPTEQRWSIKYLCVGVGGMFAFDFFLYAHSLLFQRIDVDAWIARGFIAGLTAPLVAVTAARNPHWSVNVYVSKRMLMRSTTVLLAAAYLLLAAAAGYYVRLLGGSWGAVLQNVLLFAAVLFGVAILLSRQAREKVALFLTTNFYQNKYEYGEEWIKFSDRLGRVASNAELPERTLTAICDLIHAPGGALWLRDEDTTFNLAASRSVSGGPGRLDLPPEILTSLESSGTPLELDRPAEVQLPETLEKIYDAWLLVPLLHQGRLLGVLLLTRSLTSSSYNEEDRNLLRAVARQASGYLALLQATEELTQNRQFEAYNRFSAFLVHDLKNVIGQLSMVSANAALHRDRPEFLDDALTTVDSATEKMKRVLQHLRERSAEQRSATRVDVASTLRTVVARRSVDNPKPTLAVHGEASVYADSDRLDSVVSHFVQNAQEATADDGEVHVSLRLSGDQCIITITDTGCGMSEEFLRTRLFKPFQTTKGNAGMGIGVYEGREFARSLGGEVTVSSEPDSGTVFEIRLPADKAYQEKSMVQSEYA